MESPSKKTKTEEEEYFVEKEYEAKKGFCSDCHTKEAHMHTKYVINPVYKDVCKKEFFESHWTEKAFLEQVIKALLDKAVSLPDVVRFEASNFDPDMMMIEFLQTWAKALMLSVGWRNWNVRDCIHPEFARHVGDWNKS